MRTWKHQIFAAGDNNNQSARSYTLEFKELLQAVFEQRSYFGDFFAGGLEAIDGIQEKDVAFVVKTSDVPCAINTGSLAAGGTPAYDTGANVAFGTGTGSTSRFGQRTEVIYTNTSVPYTWDWVIHEGIDRHTVNNEFDSAIADRLELQARAKVAEFNVKHAAFISANAGDVVYSVTKTSDGIVALFNTLHESFVDAGVIAGTWVAKVTPEVYGLIVDSGLMTSGKGGTVSEDDQIVNKFKGFRIEEIPSNLFIEDDIVYAYAEGVGKAFTGIETARTIEAQDFDGVALQGAGKAGEWILPDNTAAVIKATTAAQSNAGGGGDDNGESAAG